MIVSYERIISDFLDKITEYRLLNLPAATRESIVNGYMKRAIKDFSVECREKITAFDDEAETVEMESNDLDEIEFVNIISDGMVYYWFNQAMYDQTLLQNTLNTLDFSAYSPAELLKQVRAAYAECRLWFKHRMRQYTYDHGDLTDLHI